MTTTDYHIHTTFCDGKNTAEEMVAAALAAGMTQIGFSGHSYTFFDESYCMSKENTAAYNAEIERLKKKYEGQIKIFRGIEQDYYSDMTTDCYDYVIGSVHYLKFGDDYVPMDEGNANLLRAANDYCGGDVMRVLEIYYDTVADVVNKTGCDIIGHFDLPTKYFEKEALINTADARYRNAWQTAADALLKTGALFEINTGAISRGCRKQQYPADEILCYLGEKGARMVLSGDCHSCGALRCRFEEMEEKCRRFGLLLVTPAFTEKTDL